MLLLAVKAIILRMMAILEMVMVVVLQIDVSR